MKAINAYILRRVEVDRSRGAEEGGNPKVVRKEEEFEGRVKRRKKREERIEKNDWIVLMNVTERNLSCVGCSVELEG